MDTLYSGKMYKVKGINGDKQSKIFLSVNRRHTQDELSLLDVKSQVNSSEDGMSSDLKLFVQLQTKSNRRAIANALNYCCLAGPVNE
ncbi:unnamed protein product, partial [Trichobilharzia regenti]